MSLLIQVRELSHILDETTPNLNKFLTVNGNWCDWSEWGTCSASCGNGYETRTRVCNCPSNQGGGAICPGASSEERLCGGAPCCSTNCAPFVCNQDLRGDAELVYEVMCNGNCMDVRASIISNSGELEMAITDQTRNTIYCVGIDVMTCEECQVRKSQATHETTVESRIL